MVMANKKNKAFILAAGLGTRLKPFTDTLPKALVPYKNKPMIENVIQKLSNAGYKDILINTHHFSDLMKEYFNKRKGDENITLIFENEILGTGGAIKNAEKYLSDSDYFVVYNTDVDCEADLNLISKFHSNNNALATLCVQSRKTSRKLIVDEKGKLLGRTENNQDVIYGECPNQDESYYKAFCGIHIINSEIFNFFDTYTNPFDIIEFYMFLIKKGILLKTYDLTDIYWRDLGIPQNL